MWMLLPIFGLAIVHLSGNNVAMIPDLAGVLGEESYLSTILIYVVLGTIIAAITVWLGVRSGQDLVAVTNSLYGVRGKKVLAVSLLSISIPASALTGGYYGSGVLQLFTGIPYWGSGLICLILFSLLAVSNSHELLKLSNYIALLLIPILSGVIFFIDVRCHLVVFRFDQINWLLVFGLMAYNVGGMWTALMVEAGAALSQCGRKAIVLVVLAKLVEGIFTLCMAYLVLVTGTLGPLALTGVVSKVGNITLVYLFNIVLFCMFASNMAPAMLVNARQISCLTGLSFWPALWLATILVYLVGFFNFSLILLMMGYTGFIMILFIIYLGYSLHKNGINQQ